MKIERTVRVSIALVDQELFSFCLYELTVLDIYAGVITLNGNQGMEIGMF